MAVSLFFVSFVAKVAFALKRLQNDMKIIRTVYLIGFMGAGKSHHGRLLADRLGVPFHDLDLLVEEEYGATIAGLFTLRGEAGFRKLERDTLLDTSGLGHSVIATGGGTPCHFDNMAWMNENGCTIYLDVPVNILAERLKKERELRPLLAGVKEDDLEQFIGQLLERRMAFYRHAHRMVNYDSGNIHTQLIMALQELGAISPS